MRTLTYPYGETPEEVIVSQFDTRFTPHDWAEQTEPWARVLCSLPDTESLLTVLDALCEASEMFRDMALVDSRKAIQAVRFRRLRISILSALGIDEG